MVTLMKRFGLEHAIAILAIGARGSLQLLFSFFHVYDLFNVETPWQISGIPSLSLD